MIWVDPELEARLEAQLLPTPILALGLERIQAFWQATMGSGCAGSDRISMRPSCITS